MLTSYDYITLLEDYEQQKKELHEMKQKNKELVKDKRGVRIVQEEKQK